MNKNKIKSIWFECDSWSEPYDPNDCNTDVIFTLSDETKWMATFFTYTNILSLQKKNNATGECLNGLYFCATDMILIEKVDKESIGRVLEDLLISEEYKTYCTLLSD